jgi:hypothetical protein
MKNEYTLLTTLENNPGFQLLQQLWVHQATEIQKERDRAAKRGSETAWRYWAGQETGFSLAVTALQRAIKQMENENENIESESRVDLLLNEIRGEAKP